MMCEITILYSGGLDSLGMEVYARTFRKNANVRYLFFNIGQPYASKEIAALPSFVEIRKVDWLRDESEIVGKDNATGNIYIPGRNLTLATLAASINQPDEIWMGVLKGEAHAKATDKNENFRRRTSTALSYVHQKPMEVEFPLLGFGLTKLSLVKWLLSEGVTPEQITRTSSCLSGGPAKNCGNCVVCLRRWGVFAQTGISEQYAVDPPTSPQGLKIIHEMIHGNYYDADRMAEIIPALVNFRPEVMKQVTNAPSA